MKGETKEERFKRVGEKRVQHIIEGITKLSQCSNAKLYEWDEKQLSRIWSAIEYDLEKCKKSFSDPESKLFKL